MTTAFPVPGILFILAFVGVSVASTTRVFTAGLSKLLQCDSLAGSIIRLEKRTTAIVLASCKDKKSKVLDSFPQAISKAIF